MANAAKQIIGSFEDIGKDIARETVNIPKEIIFGKPKKPETQEQKIDKTKARSALETLAQPSQKEPGVYERIQKENAEKQQALESQKEKLEKQILHEPTPAAKRGNLFGVTKLKAGSESGKNVRGD